MAKNLLDVLAAKGVLSLEEAVSLKAAARKKGVSAEEILYQQGIKEESILQAKSEILGIPARRLEGNKVPFEVLSQVPEESARFYQFVPLASDGDVLEIGMVHPEDIAAQQALKFISSRVRRPFRIFLIAPSDFQAVLREYQSIGGEVTKALFRFEEEAKERSRPQLEEQQEKLASITEEAPITKIVEVIIKHAVEGRASDIHIEPMRDGVRVRFRQDGVLYTSLNLPTQALQAIVNRIKILTRMKIDETRVPQDGRFHDRVNSKEIDFRVSTLPTPFGETVAIRILDPEVGVKTLPDLGLSGRNLTVLEESLQRPYGMILITGPTGSGKSTTLYALLQILNREGVNIISLEDPIEYYIPGVNQSQIRPEIGYDFATGLRNILRQDPDIIMVGEIRDKETAKLATQAALTGHLVLSTLHTNNAVGVIPRLIDMEVDPFLIPSTLILAVAQRLVRKLCPDSRKVVKSGAAVDFVKSELEKMPPSVREELNLHQLGGIYESEVSSSCPKGTSGRIGIFEMIAMTPELEQIINEGPTEAKIGKEVERQQMLSMRQDGIVKVLNGIIGIKELREVA